MPMPELSPDKVVELNSSGNAQSSFAPLPEGIYCFAVMDTEETFSKEATQAMMVTHLAPCTKNRQKKTAVADRSQKYYTMLFHRQDEDAFRASVAGKLASKMGCEPAALQEVDIQAAIAERGQRDFSKMRRTICAIIGNDEFPMAPMRNKETNQYEDNQGRPYTREQANAMWEARNTAIYNTCREIVNGEKDIRGYVVYGRVVADTWNGKPTTRIVALYENLPEGESLVPVKVWNTNA